VVSPIRWGWIALPALVGCFGDRPISERERDIARIAGHAAPLDQLRGVALDMPRTALHAARPNLVEQAPGLLVEEVFGDTVTYHLEPSDRLRRVGVKRVLPTSDSVALVLWRQVVTELSRGRPTAAACLRSPGGGGGGTLAATWTAAAHAVVVQLAGTILELTVAGTLAEAVPDHSAWQPLPCP
jgi:hypothetical protein